MRNLCSLARLSGALSLFAAVILLALPARAEIVKFQAMLDQGQAIPAPVSVGDAGGRAYVTLETETNEIAWVIEYHSLSGEIVAAHYHVAAHGATGDVAIEISTVSETMGELSGSAKISDDQVQQMLNGLWYVNIHTELNGPGEIRGQLIRQ